MDDKRFFGMLAILALCIIVLFHHSRKNNPQPLPSPSFEDVFTPATMEVRTTDPDEVLRIEHWGTLRAWPTGDGVCLRAEDYECEAEIEITNDDAGELAAWLWAQVGSEEGGRR